MNKELMEALDTLEKEKNISKEVMLEAIENSFISACKNNFGTADNIKVTINRDTCDYEVLQEKEVVENLDKTSSEEKAMYISLADARMIDPDYGIGDKVLIPIKSKEFGRIATGVAKNVILQKIREEERKVLFQKFYTMEKDIVTGVVQRQVGKNLSVDLGRYFK